MNVGGIRGKIIRDSIRIYRGNIFLFLLTMGIFAGCGLLYRWEMEPIVYAVILCTFFGGGYLAWKIVREYRRAEERDRLVSAITSEWISLPEAANSLEEDYQEMIRKMGEQLTELQTLRQQEQKDLVDYYTVWVHQIKTPIAVSRLLLDRDDTDLSHQLEAEIFRIEQYVEMALNYTRLGSDAGDLMVRECDLNDMIRTAIHKYAGQFIGRRIRLIYQPVDKKVITDSKWFLCILEQLLSNAVKYTPQGSVTIAVDGNTVSVTDTGIGIDPADLPRIFEKGYTGMNGRSEFKSTGLGLYLCKKAADKLGLTVRAESQPGKGSTFSITFPEQDEYYHIE